MKKLVVFGTGDFARVAKVYLEEDGGYEVAAFTAHEKYIAAKEMLGRPIVPFELLAEQYPPSEYAMFVAIGFSRLNRARAEVYDAAKAAGYELVRYICSKAVVWGDLSAGDNVFVFENNVIQPYATIGYDTILWSGNHIGHDARIGNHCFLSSHVVVSGHVTVEDHCFIGVNATIRDGITIGAGSVIGAGAVITKNVAPGSVMKGIPAELSPVPSHRLKAI